MCHDDQEYITSLEEDTIEFDSKLDTLRKELAEVKANLAKLQEDYCELLACSSEHIDKLKAERDRLRDALEGSANWILDLDCHCIDTTCIRCIILNIINSALEDKQ